MNSEPRQLGFELLRACWKEQEASNSRSPEPEREAEVSFSPNPADALPSVPEFPGNDAIATGAENCGGTVGAVLESFSNREGPPPDLEPQGQDPKPAPELQAQPPPVEMSSDLAESLPAPELQAQPHPVEKSGDPAESLPAPELQAPPPPVEKSSDPAESLPAAELQAQPHPVEKSSDPAESLPAPELQAPPPPVEKSSDPAESLPAPELQAQPHPVEKSSDPAESLPAPPALQEQPEAVKAEPQMKKDFSAHVKAGILRIKRELEATEHPAAADKRAKTEPQQGHKVKKERIDPPAAAAAPSAQGIFICRILQIRACREPLKSPKDF